MSVTLLCNCYTCGEGSSSADASFICKAMTYIYTKEEDPAGFWLLNNSDKKIRCFKDADNCPCWRVGKDVAMGSYYDKKYKEVK